MFRAFCVLVGFAFAVFGADPTAPRPPDRAEAALIRDMASPDAAVRLAVADACMAPTADPLVGPLAALLNDTSWRVRDSAAHSLGFAPNRKAFDALLERAGAETDDDVMVTLVRAIGRFKSESKRAIPALCRVIRTYKSAGVPKPESEVLPADGIAVACASANALVEFGPEAVIPLANVSGDAVLAFEVRATALETLTRLGKDARPATKMLAKLVSDPDADIRERAIVAVAIADPDGAEARAALTSVLGHPDLKTRAIAAGWLYRTGDKNPWLVEVLRDVLARGGDEDRCRALSELHSMGPRAEPAIPAILASLDSKDFLVRMNAASALGRVGARRNDVMAGLTKATQDPDVQVRRAADRALKKLVSGK